jgi:hypothetical protein
LLWLLAAKKKKLLLLLQHQSLKPHQHLLLQLLQPLTPLLLLRPLLRLLLTLLLLLRPLLPLLLRLLRLLLPRQLSNSLELKAGLRAGFFSSGGFEPKTADVKKPARSRFCFMGTDCFNDFGYSAWVPAFGDPC